MKGIRQIKFRAIDIKKWDSDFQHKTGAWLPARPFQIKPSLKVRLYAAWLVFTGKCDLLDWCDDD